MLLRFFASTLRTGSVRGSQTRLRIANLNFDRIKHLPMEKESYFYILPGRRPHHHIVDDRGVVGSGMVASSFAVVRMLERWKGTTVDHYLTWPFANTMFGDYTRSRADVSKLTRPVIFTS